LTFIRLFTSCARKIQRALQLAIGHRLKLAGPANLAALDPLAGQNPFLLDRGDRSAKLTMNVRRQLGISR
jgi:hypothetical protein